MLEISDSTRSLIALVLAAAVLAAGSFGVLPARPALLSGSVLALVAAFSRLREIRAEARRRAAADDLLEAMPPDHVPRRLRWRVEELTSERERRRLARSLRSLLKTCESPLSARRSPVPLNWRSVQREREAVEELAHVLADTRTPVTARGMLLVRRLMLDAMASPLYSDEHADELASWLARARSALPRRGG